MRRKRIKDAFLWKVMLECMARQFGHKFEYSMAYYLVRLPIELHLCHLKSPQFMAVLIDNLTQDKHRAEIKTRKIGMLIHCYNSIGHLLDESLMTRPSLTVLQTKLIPEALQLLLEDPQPKRLDLQRALDLYKFYPDLP
jgi:hypothetical protein